MTGDDVSTIICPEVKSMTHTTFSDGIRWPFVGRSFRVGFLAIEMIVLSATKENASAGIMNAKARISEINILFISVFDDFVLTAKLRNVCLVAKIISTEMNLNVKSVPVH